MFGKKLPRSQIKLDPGAAAAELKTLAESLSNLDLLRIYWYDGTSTGPTHQHISLAELPNVKVRLGYVNTAGQQKGVDSLIVTDMITLARNRAMAECVLLSGDEDLRVGVHLAQEHGVRIHLLGIKPARGSQSMFLRQEADVTHEWASADLAAFLSRSFQPPPEEPVKAVDSLESVAQEVAALIADDEIAELVNLISTTNSRPKPIDGHLLALAREMIGENLDPAQKRTVRDLFFEALKARLGGSRRPLQDSGK